MAKKIKLKFNFWRVLRNLNRIRLLIEDIVDLYGRVRDLSKDPVVKNIKKRIEATLKEVFEYEG